MRLAVGSWSHHVTIFKLEKDDWLQLGSVLNATSENGLFGNNILLSPDGSRVAGEWGRPAGVSVFQMMNGDWIQLGSTLITKGQLSSFVGNRVAVYDDEYAVNGGFIDSQVQVFEERNGEWVILGSVTRGDGHSLR
jgi:hypothetical protein